MENILCRNKGKWLCNADNTSSKIEAEIQLSEATKIAFINIGNAGSAFIEILAGNSLWPYGKEYVTFLASTMLMSPADSKTGQNKERVRMFDNDSFVKGVADGEWDRLRIIIRQPYIGKKQYGLHFIDIIGDNKLTNNDTTPKASKCFAAFKSKLQVAPPAVSSSSGSNLSPPSSRAASMVKAAQLNLNLAKQKQKEESRPRKQHKVKRNSPYHVDAQLQRRKSLSRRTAGDIEDEVECFLDGFNFEKIPLESITYKHLKETMEEARGSKLSKEEKKIFLKLAERQVRDVLEKREMLDENNDTVEYSKNPAIIDLSSPKSSGSSSPIQTPSPLPKFSCTSPPVSPATSPRKSPAKLSDVNPDSLHECPLCNQFFPLQNIEFHASICVGATTRETVVLTSPARDSDIEEVQIQEVYSPVKSLKTVCDLGSGDDVPCPICNCRFPTSRIDVHANICADAGLLVSF